MSALRGTVKPRSGSARTTRLRLVKCSGCGYTARVARSWMQVGLPACPNPACANHGEAMDCGDPVDAIELGYLTLDDLPLRDRTRICHEQGWQDGIIRFGGTGPRRLPSRCQTAGCGSFVAAGQRHCASHASHEMPF